LHCGPASACRRAVAGERSGCGEIGDAADLKYAAMPRSDRLLPSYCRFFSTAPPAAQDRAGIILDCQAANANSELFHHVRCEIRVLLNEKMEPPLIDWRKSAGGLRHSVGRTRTLIDQRDHADQRAFPLRSRTHNHQAGCPFPLPITRTSCHACRLPEKGNLRARVATRHHLNEKAPQDS
jgi:hypothetical protein